MTREAIWELSQGTWKQQMPRRYRHGSHHKAEGEVDELESPYAALGGQRAMCARADQGEGRKLSAQTKKEVHVEERRTLTTKLEKK